MPEAKSLEAKKIAERVKQLKADDPSASIAILARTRNQFKHIVAEFRAEGIDWLATDIDRLSTLTIISDLIALLRALINPADKIAWLAILRAPWCGLDSADLFYVVNSDKNASIWKNLQTLSRSLTESQNDEYTLSKEGLARVTAISSTLDVLLQARMHCSVRELMECAWQLLGGDALIANNVEERSVAYFFTQCDQHENCYGIDDVEAFAETIEQSFIPSEINEAESQESGTVHLMTIHKSKGLQYDHVIIPQLNGKSRSNDKDLVILHNRLNRRGVARLFIAALPDPGNETGGNKQPDDTLYEFVKGEHKQKDLYEETRLIYIAMTRAKHSVSLYATLPENTDKEGNAKALAPANNCLLARIWEPLLGLSDFSPAQIAIGAPTKNTPVESADHFPAITPIKRFRTVCRVSEDQMRIITEQLAPTLAEEKANEDTQDKERQLSKLLGTLSHAFLEAFCLSAFDPEVTLHALAPRWRRKLIILGVDEAQAEARIVETQRELLRCLNGSNRWVFDSVGVQAECELKLATSERQGDEEYHKHRVVDRTLVVNEERWIIDFKTSHKHEAQTEEEFIASQKEEYRPQLESYGELFRGFEDTPQRLALLLTSIDALVEL